jgi:hypothetical protein
MRSETSVDRPNSRALSPIAPIEGTQAHGARSLASVFHFSRYMGSGPSQIRKLACYVALALFTAFCGFAYGMTRGNAMFLIAPLGILGIAAFWTMPDMRHPPVRMLRSLMTLMLFLYLCWPDYIALVIGGLPWISAARLTCFPLAFVLLICAFGSRAFRLQMIDIIRGDKLIVWLFLAFYIYAGLTIAISTDTGFAADKFVVFTYSAVIPFFAAIYIFNAPNRTRVLAYYLFVIAAYNLVIGLMESAHSALPWAKDIPGFLKIEDPQINARLVGTMRSTTNDYRVGSRFSTSIGLGEYFGFALPFMLHLFFTEKSLWMRLILALSVPPMFYIVMETGSRLGFICFVSSIMLYVFYQAAIVWRNRPNNIFAPAIMLTYPVMMAAFVVLSFAWHRLHLMVFGGGAAQFSTLARQEQWAKGIPLILESPWGHGVGSGAGTLQYYATGSDFPTIDSYYLSILLEFGIPIFIVFYGMFVWAIGRSVLAALKTRDADVAYLAAVGVALANFVIGKSVYSQQENHTLAYLLLGVAVALLQKHAFNTGKLPAPPSEKSLYPPISEDYGKDWKRRPIMLG